MLKRRTTIFLSAVLLFGAAAGLSWNRGTEAAAAESVSLGAETAELFLPESYEQYLPLSKPVSFAMSSDYVAIADGSTLYLFDRESGTYSEYNHKKYPAGTDEGTISKVQIAPREGPSNDRIFFSDIESHLYEYGDVRSETGHTVRDMIVSDVPVTTFLIDETGESLFTANYVTESGTISLNRYSIPDDKLQSPVPVASESLVGNNPLLAADNGKLYIVYNSNSLAIYNALTLDFYEKSDLDMSILQVAGLQSIGVYNGEILFTVNGREDALGNGLYRSSNRTAEFLPLEGDKNNGLSALSVYGGELYCIRGTSVQKLGFDEDGQAFLSDYEICASSDSEHRLNGAKDIARAGNLLVTANSGSNRLLVHNIADGTHRVVPCTDEDGLPYSPTLVATDGTIVAAASENRIFVYTSDWSGAWNLLETHTLEGQDAVKGIACVYGKVYYASSHHRGVVGGAELLNANTPVGLSADLYGDLYIAYIDNSVCRFTEHDFLLAGTDGERQTYTLPSGYSSVRADFEGNLYCLGEDGAVYKNGEPFCTVDGKDFVYRKESTMPSSFALGFEDDEVYFCFGDFIVRSEGGALGFPSLGTISAAGVTEQLAEVKPKEDVRLLDVGEGTIGIRVDLDTLGEDTEYFPFHSYARTDADARGVLLAETEKYLLVALYENKAYTVELFRADRCTEAEPIWTDAEGTLYLAGETALYRFPCLTAAKSESPLPRGTSVKVLSVLRPDGEDGADRGLEFAYVECETNARASVRGYVPLSLLTDADPNGVPDETYFFGTLKEDVVFRGGDGSEHTVEKGTQVKLYENADGTYTAQLQSEDGTLLATVEAGMIARGESDALRIALIVILTVVAVGIIGAYIFLLPWRKK